MHRCQELTSIDTRSTCHFLSERVDNAPLRRLHVTSVSSQFARAHIKHYPRRTVTVRVSSAHLGLELTRLRRFKGMLLAGWIQGTVRALSKLQITAETVPCATPRRRLCVERSEGIGEGNVREYSSPKYSNGLSAQPCFSSTVRACFLRGGQCDLRT